MHLFRQADGENLIVADDHGIAVVSQADEVSDQAAVRKPHVMGIEALAGDAAGVEILL